MLIIKDLSLSLSKDLRLLLEDFTFSLQEDMKVALIGEEGNGKSTLLKAIAEPQAVKSYAELEGEIITSGEVLGYLPQVLSENLLDQTTKEYFDSQIKWDFFDYAEYHRLLLEMEFSENRISDHILIRNLSGGEKIKFQLLCEMLKRPTVLLLDEPSNDLDLGSVRWLEDFICKATIPIMFVSHDEMLLERCANTIIHLEQLMRKSQPHHTIARLGYGEYVTNREERLIKQTQVAKKEKAEYEAKMERYRQIYQRVHHEQQVVSRRDPSTAKNLKDKMHTVKAMGKRFEQEKGRMTERPDYEKGIEVIFDKGISIPNGKLVLDLQLETLEIGGLILSHNIDLKIYGPQKIGITGSNGAGKTTLLRQVLKNLTDRGISFGYMPQDYGELMEAQQNAIEFLSRDSTKVEHTLVRTYLGSMNFTSEEMFHPIQELSGGQRAKLYFAKMVLEGNEVLVLDEPTRNLSPLSGPEVRLALKDFGGCIIAVSHDRKFLTEVCHKILNLNAEGLH